MIGDFLSLAFGVTLDALEPGVDLTDESDFVIATNFVERVESILMTDGVGSGG